MRSNNQKNSKHISKQQNMEFKPAALNVVLGNKSNGSDNSRTTPPLRMDKPPVSSWFAFLFDGNTYRNYYLPRLRSVLKNAEMAELKLGWIILNMIGIPVYVLGIVNNLDNWKSGILFLMGLLYSLTLLMRSYETWRTKKISNDRELFHLENEKNKKQRITK